MAVATTRTDKTGRSFLHSLSLYIRSELRMSKSYTDMNRLWKILAETAAEGHLCHTLVEGCGGSRIYRGACGAQRISAESSMYEPLSPPL